MNNTSSCQFLEKPDRHSLPDPEMCETNVTPNVPIGNRSQSLTCALFNIHHRHGGTDLGFSPNRHCTPESQKGRVRRPARCLCPAGHSLSLFAHPFAGSHKSFPASCSSNRTCGFPASGFQLNSCLRPWKILRLWRKMMQTIGFP